MKKIIILFLILFPLLFPKTTSAAIAFDAITNSTGSGTSITFSHTTSGSDRFLTVILFGDDSDPNDEVTGVTYGGISMTRAGWVWTRDRGCYVYYLANPTTGANNVVVSFSASQGYIEIEATSYTGVDQITPVTAITEYEAASFQSSPYTQSITTTVDNSWLVMGVTLIPATNIAAGTGTYYRGNRMTFDSNGAKTPAGSHSLQVTYTGTTIKPSAVIMAVSPVVSTPYIPKNGSNNIWW